MNLWWLYAILAIAAALTIAAIIILVGCETEERPGYVDLTAIRCGRCKRPARLGYVLCRRCLRRERRAGRGRYPTAVSLWPPVSRVRAQADLDRQAWRHPDGAIVYARPGDFDEAGMVAAGFERDDAA